MENVRSYSLHDDDPVAIEAWICDVCGWQDCTWDDHTPILFQFHTGWLLDQIHTPASTATGERDA